MSTFGRMRDEMVFAALRCKRPKWLVLLSLMRGKHWTEDELFYRPDEVSLLGTVTFGQKGMQAECMVRRRWHDMTQSMLDTCPLPLLCLPCLPACSCLALPAAARGGARGAALIPGKRGAQRRAAQLPGAVR